MSATACGSGSAPARRRPSSSTWSAQRVKAGLKLPACRPPRRRALQAERLGIPLTTLDETPALDLTVDGADELDAKLRLIKGGGGALLREKIVATASKRMIVIADASKRVATLGKFPLPVEVVRFGLAATRRMVEALAADAGCKGEIKLRLAKDGQPFTTDGGNTSSTALSADRRARGAGRRR